MSMGIFLHGRLRSELFHVIDYSSFITAKMAGWQAIIFFTFIKYNRHE